MKLEWLERRFIFRVSRGLFITIVVAVTLALAASVLVFFYSFLPAFKVTEAVKPQPPALASVTSDEIVKEMTEKKSGPESPQTEPQTPSTAPDDDQAGEPAAPSDPAMQKVSDLLEKIHAEYFPGNGYPWFAVSDTVCIKRNFANKCLEYGKRKVKDGVQDVLNHSLSDLGLDGKIVLLNSILAAMPMVPKPEEIAKAEEETGYEKKEEPRVLAVLSLTDVTRAFGGPPKDVIGQIVGLFEGGAEDPNQAIEPLPNDQKVVLFELLLNIRKKDSTPEALVAFLKSWKNAVSMFPPQTRLEGLSNAWLVLKGLPPEQIPSTMAMLNEALAGIGQEERPAGVLVFDRLLKDKMRSTQAEYGMAISKYDEEKAMLEAERNRRLEEKKGLRLPAVYGIAGGIVIIAFFGLILTLLGIERNTRMLEELIKTLSKKKAE